MLTSFLLSFVYAFTLNSVNKGKWRETKSTKKSYPSQPFRPSHPQFVDPVRISQKVIQGVYPGVTTTELDELAAQTAAYNATQHPDFSVLAARISVSNLHKMTLKRFSDNCEIFYNYVHPKTGAKAPLISEKVRGRAGAMDGWVEGYPAP